ncbi:MAG: hypothetical protein ACOYNO_08875 [Saprospiraceae bacterium]
MKNSRLGLLVAVLLFPLVMWCQIPQTPNPGPSTAVESAASDSVLVTIILKHQQDKNLQELRRILEAQGFWDMFPPEDAKVLSWNIALGLGHVIVLQIPAGSVRFLNLSIENGAWGAYNTEVYLSYDYKSVWQEYMQMRGDAKADRD